jgi:hypothetical protein
VSIRLGDKDKKEIAARKKFRGVYIAMPISGRMVSDI